MSSSYGDMNIIGGTMGIVSGTTSSTYGTMRIIGGTMSNGKHVFVLSRELKILFTKLQRLPLVC